MSDCIICGQPPSICRCSLADRVERRGRIRVCIKEYKRIENANPLDLDLASAAMKELERLWRASYPDMVWLARFRSTMETA